MNRVPLNILVVEDEADIALGISRSLSRLEGVNTVACSTSAEQAIEKMRATSYNIVVSDIYLTGMNGLSLLSSIKQNNPDTQVVLMTAFSNTQIHSEALKLGSDIFLEKPFDLCELKEIVVQLMDAIWKRNIGGFRHITSNRIN